MLTISTVPLPCTLRLNSYVVSLSRFAVEACVFSFRSLVSLILSLTLSLHLSHSLSTSLTHSLSLSFLSLLSLSLSLYVCVCMCECARMNVCVYMYVYVCMHVLVCIFVCVHECTYYVCVHVCAFSPQGLLSMVTYLLYRQAPVDAKDTTGFTPLHVAGMPPLFLSLSLSLFSVLFSGSPLFWCGCGCFRIRIRSLFLLLFFVLFSTSLFAVLCGCCGYCGCSSRFAIP
jgi:hypothetical protein